MRSLYSSDVKQTSRRRAAPRRRRRRRRVSNVKKLAPRVPACQALVIKLIILQGEIITRKFDEVPRRLNSIHRSYRIGIIRELLKISRTCNREKPAA